MGNENHFVLKAVCLLNESCKRHAEIEFQLDVQAPCGNPFRSEEIALDALIQLPSGKSMTVPCFYFRDYTLGHNELKRIPDSGQWRLRFSSPETGNHICGFLLKAHNQIVCKVEGPSFVVEDSEFHGMVKQSGRSPRYLQFEDNTAYIPIGQNLCFLSERAKRIPISPDCGLFPPFASTLFPWNTAYERWMKGMSENGANWARFWMRPTFYLEDGESWQWNQENAWKLDYILQRAEYLGIHVCFCLEDFRYLFHKIQGVSTANWFSGYDTAWVRQRKFTWWSSIQNDPMPAVKGAELTFHGLVAGKYFVEFWDTVKGNISMQSAYSARTGSLSIPLPEIKTDLALKIFRLKE